ncbi:MAG TPA: penicillin acylase family protein, partial [Polyangiaceae bacterium]
YAAACGHSGSKSPPAASLGPFGPSPAITTTTQVSNLSGPVDVVRDTNGLVHIWATNASDALRVEGYQIAKDRTAQLELIRRSAEGKTAELLGDSDPGLIDQDIAMRTIGLGRVAQQMYDALPAGSEAKAYLDAYADGISQFNARLQTGDESLPKSMIGISPSAFVPWTGADCVAVARFEEWNLAYTADDEIADTAFAQAARTTFASTSRAGFLVDTMRFAPIDPTLAMPGGFPDDPAHTLALFPRSPRSPAHPSHPSARTPLVPTGVLSAASGFVKATAARRDALAKLGVRGSNDWIVAPSRTATGHAMLANDPHLSLSAPAVFWIVQIDAHDPAAADTSEDIHVEGTAFPGIPGIILGFNQNIAWGATTADYDVTDVYSETLTPDGSGVVFQGMNVPFQTAHEEIAIAGSPPLEYDVLLVPQHGPVVPTIVNHKVVPPDPTAGAMSIKWTGSQPTSELPGVLTGFMRATSVEDFRTAIRDFAVGAQNWVVADTGGNVFYTTQSQIPLRDKRAYTWDPSTFTGTLPCFVEAGDGSAEWTGQFLDEAYVPHVKNPSQGYVGTANGDQVGDTLDDDPSNDTTPDGKPIYMACYHDPGFRVGRIHQLIEGVGHPMALGDMATIQADARSAMGAQLAPGLVTSLEHAMAEAAAPGTHPDLTADVQSPRYQAADIQPLHDLLVQWGGPLAYDTPPGVSLDDGSLSTDMTEVAASEATLVFDVWLMRMPLAVFGDEWSAVGVGVPYDGKVALAYLMNAKPASLATYDASVGDSVLFDDMTTAGVTETRDERAVTSLLDALDYLNTTLGTDRTKWRWGALHTLRFASLVSLWDSLSIPPIGDAKFPNGFPRHGDGYNIDVGDPGLASSLATATFTYSEGPTQRFVIDMDPSGPTPRNVLPGGEVWDSASPHFADEAELWRRNENHPLWVTHDDVAANAEERDSFTP